MIWTLVWIVLGIIVLILLLRFLFGLIWQNSPLPDNQCSKCVGRTYSFLWRLNTFRLLACSLSVPLALLKIVVVDSEMETKDYVLFRLESISLVRFLCCCYFQTADIITISRSKKYIWKKFDRPSKPASTACTQLGPWMEVGQEVQSLSSFQLYIFAVLLFS